MDIFLKVLFIIVVLAIFVGMIAAFFIDVVAEWVGASMIGILAGVIVCSILAIPVDLIVAGSGHDKDTFNAGKLVLIIIGLAIAIFVTIWIRQNCNLF